MTQQVEAPRISEGPENYAAVFHSARQTAEAIRAGNMEPSEGTAIARNDGNALGALNADQKGRILDHRLRSKDITPLAGSHQPQIGDGTASSA